MAERFSGNESSPSDSALSDECSPSLVDQSLEDDSSDSEDVSGFPFDLDGLADSLRFKKRSRCRSLVCTPKNQGSKKRKINSAPSTKASSHHTVSNAGKKGRSSSAHVSQPSFTPVPGGNLSSTHQYESPPSSSEQSQRRPTAARSRQFVGNTPNSRGQDSRCSGRVREAVEGSEEPTPDQTERPIGAVLGEITNMLGTVIKRLDKTELKLESMERKLINTSSSGSSSERTGTAKKRDVPKVVRTETRMTYKSLLDCDEEFTGFDTSPETTYKHATNQAITNLLVKEVLGHNPTFTAADIRAAAYTYYKSLCQEEALKRKGTYAQRKVQRRRRERVVRRLSERQAEFRRHSYSDGDRIKWEKVFTADLISSDESEVEEDKPVLVVKELVWRSDKVTNFFTKLDNAHDAKKSEQANRQTKSRVRRGVVSGRPAPAHLPSWAVNMNN